MPHSHALAAAGVGKVFSQHGDPITALDGIELTIDTGEFVTVLGPSGCGKSTLLAILAGLEQSSTGKVTANGVPVTAPLTDAGFMFQRDLLLDWRTCEDNILLQFAMRGQPVKPHRLRAKEMLALVGMSQFTSRYPRELSGGMRQRVAICRALVHAPPLLFLDEPFAALDALTRERLNVELGRLTSQAATTVVLVTHSIDEALYLGDRVVVMSPRPGRIVGELRVGLARPRGAAVLTQPDFTEHAARLREMLSAPLVSAGAPHE